MTIIDRRYSVAEGTAVKAPCRVATTANITLSGLQTIDGVALAADDRVLVRAQSTGSQNGIYSASSGNWSRTRDFDGAYDIVTGTRIYVNAGSTYTGVEFVVTTTGTITIDSTSIAFGSLMGTAVTAAAASATAAASSATTASTAATAAASSASAASTSASAASTSATAAAASAASAIPALSSFKNLSIKVATTSTVTVAADYVVLSDGTSYKTLAISGTLNMGVNGAVNRLDAGSVANSTFYSVWAIAKSDGTQGTLASTSATSPTLPSSYTFKARIGWVVTNGSGNLHGTWQLGRRAQYVVGLAGTTGSLPNIANGTTGTFSSGTPTWASTSVSTVVPSTASEIAVVAVAAYNGNAVGSWLIAPNGNYGGQQSANPPFMGQPALTGVHGPWTGRMLLESTNISLAMSGAGCAVFCAGWEDNI